MVKVIFMNNIIKLDNNYYFELCDELNRKAINIQDLKLRNIRKHKCLEFNVDFKEIERNEYRKILRNLLKLKKYQNIKRSKNFGNKLGYIINYDNINTEQTQFIQAINAIFCKTRYERYNYIYDTVCEYLDGFFYGKNLCEFENNKCGEKRNTTSTCGCCRHGKIRKLGPLTKLVQCEYLKKDFTCGAKCISCKLFTCDYLKKKGINFKIKDILLLDTFFNPVQKYYIKTMVYTPKEKIIKRLMVT